MYARTQKPLPPSVWPTITVCFPRCARFLVSIAFVRGFAEHAPSHRHSGFASMLSVASRAGSDFSAVVLHRKPNDNSVGTCCMSSSRLVLLTEQLRARWRLHATLCTDRRFNQIAHVGIRSWPRSRRTCSSKVCVSRSLTSSAHQSHHAC
jgi:hypothetical protein